MSLVQITDSHTLQRFVTPSRCSLKFATSKHGFSLKNLASIICRYLLHHAIIPSNCNRTILWAIISLDLSKSIPNKPTWFPKYAAFAIWQKRPTSTTPVNILICDIIWMLIENLWIRSRLKKLLTTYGLIIFSRSKGASMIKFPLSVTTGPASKMTFKQGTRDVNLKLTLFKGHS